jgi:hypothetical protein
MTTLSIRGSIDTSGKPAWTFTSDFGQPMVLAPIDKGLFKTLAIRLLDSLEQDGVLRRTDR